MLDLVLQNLLDLSHTVIACQIGLIQHDNIVTIVLLVLFADQHPVQEHGGIRVGFAIGGVDHVDDGVDLGQSGKNLLLGDVVADVVDHGVFAALQAVRG